MGEDVVKSLADKSDEHEFYSPYPKGYQRGMAKYLVVLGTVISGLGKGITAASLGNLLKRHGANVTAMKFDGYLNLDAGTLNPFRHGEVFVLDDGTECDMDLGTYERFLGEKLTKNNYLTGGKLFSNIMSKERDGRFLGRDVQFIPHVTGEIKHFVRNLALTSRADVVIIEVGGTVGDIENSYFIEAMRELALEEGRENVAFMVLTYVMLPKSVGEQKSKAAQLGLRSLMGAGIMPDVVVVRAEDVVSNKVKEKLSVYSNVPVDNVIDSHNMKTIYKVPLKLHDERLDEILLKRFGLPFKNIDLDDWNAFVDSIVNPKREVTVAITGKYTQLNDSYASILSALEHAGAYHNAEVKIKWVETTDIEDGKIGVEEALQGVEGVIVPGGFGRRGVEGKIAVVKHLRENKIPYLGLCYGFQMAVIEFARDVCGLDGANTTESDPNTKHPVIDILPEQKKIEGLGGNMRLGGRDVEVKP
ncbi:MAG: CTP synthase, partial [Candidatus Diapherotrites archaeon]|nr:CTP synthase [Candidatus Diapherotrites archaeon]